MTDTTTAAPEAAEQLKAMTAERDAATAALEAMTAERDAAQAALEAMTRKQDKTAKDLKAARAQAAPKSARARAIGPVPPPKGHKGDWRQPRGADLLTLIAAADTVELVFSDGAREITALAPQLISGPAWHMGANGVKLRLPSLLIHGPARDASPLSLAGYGLVLDGELTAWSPRIDVLKIMPGSQHELKDDVIFQ